MNQTDSSAPAEPKPAKKYNRKVYGRRAVTLNSKEWTIELQAKALVLHEKYSRKKTSVPLSEAVDQLAIGQKLLPI